MQKKDWFRSSDWNPEIEADFEKRLKRSRRGFHQAQYLKIQGLTLLESKDVSARSKGVELLKRVISKYPDQTTEAAHSHELLADYFKKTKNFAAAEVEYRNVLAYYSSTPSRTNTTGLADLSFVELILEWNAAEKYKEGELLLDRLAEIKIRHIAFNSDVLRYHAASARLLLRVGRFAEASTHAGFALKAAQIKASQFPRHPGIGVPLPSAELVDEMKQIVDFSKSSSQRSII